MINNCQYCGNSHETPNQSRVCASHHGFKTLRQRQAAPAPVLVAPRPASPTFSQLTSRLDLPKDGKARRYAFYLKPGDEHSIVFFQARKARTTGRVYVDGYSGAGTHRISPKEAYRDLIRVVDHQGQAQALFGQKIGYCGRCGSELTVIESRERGLGPTCAEKVGA